MKHQTLIFLLASVMLIVGFSCGCKKEPPMVVDTEKPVISLLDTANNSQNSITFIFGFTDNKGVTSATLSVAGQDYNVLNKTSENITNLTANTLYTATLIVKDLAGNTASKSISFTTLAEPILSSIWLGAPQVSYGTQFAVEQNAVSNQLTITINNGAGTVKSATSLLASFGANGSAVKMLRYKLNGGNAWNVLTINNGKVDFGGIQLQPGVNTFICYFSIKVNAGVANGSPISFQFTSLDDGAGAGLPVGGAFQSVIPLGTINSVTQATVITTEWAGATSIPGRVLTQDETARSTLYYVNTLRATGPSGARIISLKLKNPYSSFSGLVFDNTTWSMTIGTGDKSITNYLWQSEYVTLILPSDNNTLITNGTTYNEYYVKCTYRNTSAITFNSNDYTYGKIGLAITSKYDLIIQNADGQVIDLSDVVVKQDGVLVQ